MAGGPALGGGLAIDDRLAPRRAVHDPVVPDHAPLAWQVKGEARRAAGPLHEAMAVTDARTAAKSHGEGQGDPNTEADNNPDAEPATGSIGRAAGRGLRWRLIGAASTRLGGLADGRVGPLTAGGGRECRSPHLHRDRPLVRSTTAMERARVRPHPRPPGIARCDNEHEVPCGMIKSIGWALG
jgi:hypothetical protein